jgi:phasin family protein
MQPAIQTVLDLCQAQIRASTALANAIMTGAEKMEQVVRNASKVGIGEQVDFVKTAAGVRDPELMATMQAVFAEPIPERVGNYYNELVRVISQTNAAIEKVIRDYQEEFSENLVNPMHVAGGFPAGGVPETIQNLIKFWDSAYQNLTGVTDQYLRAQATQVRKAQTERVPAAKSKVARTRKKS